MTMTSKLTVYSRVVKLVSLNAEGRALLNEKQSRSDIFKFRVRDLT